jgi:hypothetical protein
VLHRCRKKLRDHAAEGNGGIRFRSNLPAAVLLAFAKADGGFAHSIRM